MFVRYVKHAIYFYTNTSLSSYFDMGFHGNFQYSKPFCVITEKHLYSCVNGKPTNDLETNTCNSIAREDQSQDLPSVLKMPSEAQQNYNNIYSMYAIAQYF